MHRTVRLLLATVMALLALCPSLGAAIAHAQVQDGATLTVLRGQVAVVSPDGSAVQPAPSGTIVRSGDEIRTLTKTGALITFFAGTEIEMGEDTILVVDQVTKNGSKVDISLKQVLGTTLNRVQSLTDPTSSYKIDAGGAVAVVRGTTFLLIGPVPTSAGNISALVCMDDCDGRTTFSGCPVSQYTAFGVEVDKGKATTGCETAAVAHTGDYFDAGFEAITTFEQTFTSANDGDHSPGIINLGRDEGQRKADERNERHDRDDDKPQAASLLPCGIASGGVTPGGTFLFPGNGSVVEGNSGTTTLNVPVTLVPASSTAVTVSYATGGGTATAGVDYQATSGTLTFPAGSTQQNIPITVNGDTTPESDEIVAVTLSNPSGATLLVPTAFGRILDDDNPAQLTIDNPHVFEGNSGTANLAYTVTLSRAASSAVSVSYQTTGGTATPGTDYTGVASPQTLTIPAGATNGTINISVNGDTTVEPDETVIVTLSNPSSGASILTPDGIGTIIDDDGPATLAITGDATHEGCQDTTTLQFTVQLSHPVGTSVTVNYATADGTATAGSDYQAASGTLTFAPGETSRTIDVTVNSDTNIEPDETFTVRLTNSSGATISIPTATGTILNDD
jgi:chitinase